MNRGVDELTDSLLAEQARNWQAGEPLPVEEY
jgi:hypothetical protein